MRSRHALPAPAALLLALTACASTGSRAPNTVSLDELKQHADRLGEEFALIRRGNRLSILPVTAAQWKFILSLENPK